MTEYTVSTTNRDETFPVEADAYQYVVKPRTADSDNQVVVVEFTKDGDVVFETSEYQLEYISATDNE